MIWIFWLSVLFVAYTFAGYPVLVWLIAKLRNRVPRRAEQWPTASLIVAIHGNAELLQQKLQNCLRLKYPREKLEIIIAEDGRDSAVATIAAAYEKDGIKLVTTGDRQGKHYAQMLARNASRGEILVFTDAAVQLEPDSLEKIVASFADPSVGCVSSEDCVPVHQETKSGEPEYVSFEMWLRRLEARANSLVSVSGSFFAARRRICDRWHEYKSSDFFLALHSFEQGYRVVVDPAARAYMGVVGSPEAEFQRKIRTIVHGLDVFFSHLPLLNPVQYGLFSWQLVSHKLFRWLLPFAFAALFLSNALLWRTGIFYSFCLICQSVLYSSGILSVLVQSFRGLKLFKAANMFLVGNVATAVAWTKFCTGERFLWWEPSRR